MVRVRRMDTMFEPSRRVQIAMTLSCNRARYQPDARSAVGANWAGACESDPRRGFRLGRATRHPRCDLSARAETQFGQDAFDVAVGCAFGND